ncbi:MoaD/ThiS family protein [Alkalisalibacterium limincola]|uniref:MoaD/ThiS family protein n=1 Tax=Alkalisalibacterium limincola TaxID=2699169 RepID=A0A5C8KNE4_9GAMM|nr:MoaD/ThiS family protein [Alkalisalibacterium limincola]TXK62353.1 MoaD/ThiS family protein [Alkalisalibacterium limincola]
MPSVNVRIPPALRAFTGGLDELSVQADTVTELVGALDRRHPGLAARLLSPEGGLRPYVNVFIDQDNVRQREGLSARLHEGAVVSILPAVAGG